MKKTLIRPAAAAAREDVSVNTTYGKLGLWLETTCVEYFIYMLIMARVFVVVVHNGGAEDCSKGQTIIEGISQ